MDAKELRREVVSALNIAFKFCQHCGAPNAFLIHAGRLDTWLLTSDLFLQVRLKQRLRFWRARNWAEQHKTQHVSAPSTTGPQYMIDEAPGMRRSSSESADSRLTDTMTPYELGGLQGSFSVKGRDSIPSSKSPLPDQETIIHEENLKQGDLLPERTPSFVVFGRSPNQSPRDSRVGSLVPVARDSRAGSLTRSRTNSKGSVSIRRDSPAGAEALRLQTSPVRPNSL